MRSFAIFLSLYLTACGGVVVREEDAGATKPGASGDGGAMSRRTPAGSASAEGGASLEGAGGFSSGGERTYTGGTSAAGGTPYAGGRGGTGGFIDVVVDASVGGGGFMGGAAGSSGGVAGGADYVCAARRPSDPGPDPSCTSRLAGTPPLTCTTTALTSGPGGLEGRCIPRCILRSHPLASLFDAGDPACPSGLVCAPCYDPIDATPTGACTMPFIGERWDAPTKPAPAPYAACPDGDAGVAPYAGGGVCVPGAIVDRLSDPSNPLYDPLVVDLKQDSCATGEKCVPRDKAADPRHCATPCTTTEALVGITYSAGACVPEYVVYDTSGQAGVQLTRGPGGEPAACGKGELCYPCNNPLRPGQPTGACY